MHCNNCRIHESNKIQQYRQGLFLLSIVKHFKELFLQVKKNISPLRNLQLYNYFITE